ncbi:MAG: hypothetical protein ACRCV1_08195, partial [Leuconostoc mesenteroides]
MSNENRMMIFSDCKITQVNSRYGITFTLSTGEVGVVDWLGEVVDRKTDKVIAKKARYEQSSTEIRSLTGLPGAGSGSSSGRSYPAWGVGRKSGNFKRSNFTGNIRFTEIFIPIESIINGFDNLSKADQDLFVSLIDHDFLSRITPCWYNKIGQQGYLRIPFSWTIKNLTSGYAGYVDLSFTMTSENKVNVIDFKSINFESSLKQTVNNQFVLNHNNGIMKPCTIDIKDQPDHPKLISGCFVESGGHVKVYGSGHRQYICYYHHDVTSLTQWIGENKTIKITDVTLKDISKLSNNGWYGENLRHVPIRVDDDSIRYLSFMRDQNNKFRYSVFSLPKDVSITNENFVKTSDLVWLDRKNEYDFPLVVQNLD